MLTSHPQTRDRCRVCGLVLPAWFAVARAPYIAMLLGHPSGTMACSAPISTASRPARTSTWWSWSGLRWWRRTRRGEGRSARASERAGVIVCCD